MTPDSVVNILLVEDDEIDVEAIKRSFSQNKIANPIIVARDGVEALEMLRGQGAHKPIEPPFMILLDINMPRMNGLEFLEEIRKDKALKASIVFILTTSNDDQDRMKAYEKNVAGYMLKKHAGDQFSDAIKMLKHYWRIVEFPSS